MAPPPDAVFATLLMNDDYLPGAMVLGHSLKDKGLKAKMVVLVTVDSLSGETITELKSLFDEIVPVNRILNRSPANLYVMQRPDLISTFTKIELWRQTQYRRIVYIDADVVALRVPHELLTLDTEFAAVPDVGWPDCFNSGVMVLNPNLGDYYSLLALAQRGISFDGADQGLLNMHFREWERLSFAYNCTPNANYQYVPAYRHFQSSISMVHFIGRDKPWTLGRESKFNSGVYGELLGMWWAVYDRHYRKPKPAYYSGQYSGKPTRVHDYVRGEETMYLPGYSQSQPLSDQTAPSSGPPPPPIHVDRSQEVRSQTLEQPLGDQPTLEEPVLQQEFKPIPTAEVRRFSAPHVEWEPTRAPPPAHSKPEAENFPTQTYDMSSDTALFTPPTKYPEPPKDMWYEVPEKVPEPPKPKPIFPWEARAPKPTRVFPSPKAPSPEPAPASEPELARIPSPTDDVSRPSDETPATPPVGSPIPWAGFLQRTNAWDDVPEIDRYVQAFNQSRKGPIQVLHHVSPSQTKSPEKRRPSTKLTDFPSEIERPSLPVTPAPIRRPSFWGEERDEAGELPAAEGVPKQEDWVRRFSSYAQLQFPDLARPLHNLQGAIVGYWRCQYCGKQNPIAKLEELQRRQSEVLQKGADFEPKDVPEREMPESESREAAEKADIKATSPEKAPKAPKPILKEPKIGLLPSQTPPSRPAEEPSEPSEPKVDANSKGVRLDWEETISPTTAEAPEVAPVS